MMRRIYIFPTMRARHMRAVLCCPLVLAATLGTPSLSFGTSNSLKVSSLDEHPQQSAIKGNVVDKNGNPLDGVTITIKGTANSTATNASGAFEISSQALPVVLVASRVGYGSTEVTVTNNSPVSITLTDAATGLDEVVVVGFGSQKKENLTG